MYEKVIQFFKKAHKQMLCFSGWILFCFALIGGYHAFTFFVQDLVKKTMVSSEMVELISSKIRPVVIFDSDSRVISGKNAMKSLLDDIEIKKNEKDDVVEITITTKELLNTPPFMEGLDRHYRIYPKKGEKFKWIYTIKEPSEVEDSTTLKTGLRFKLEFLD